MEVIVQAGIMAAPASSVINSNGETESVMLKEMIMLQRQTRNQTVQGLVSHLHFTI